ncbi:hypothetical protein M9H77_34813 [Catharanthus roseus]|uniref:Uncharacterized protein n=1 Tax=Catharanthus roseus TaxID=4058 RepID=A0ACB9ZMY4_CATRO|nr:hypothetical protein M9H77_34813 [Catharanthus roseus]
MLCRYAAEGGDYCFEHLQYDLLTNPLVPTKIDFVGNFIGFIFLCIRVVIFVREDFGDIFSIICMLEVRWPGDTRKRMLYLSCLSQSRMLYLSCLSQSRIYCLVHDPLTEQEAPPNDPKSDLVDTRKLLTLNVDW